MRKKINLEIELGVALCRINNADEEDASKQINMGCGNNIKHIQDWIDDIWKSYQKNDIGVLTPEEFKDFVD